LFAGDPDGGVTLYYNGSTSVLTTSTGAAVRDTSGSVPIFALQTDAGTSLAQFTHFSSAFRIASNVHGDNTIITAEDAVGTAQNLFVGDPDGATDLYYDGSIAAGTQADGGFSRDTSGTSPSHLWRDDTGTSVGRVRSNANEFYLENLVDSGRVFIQGLDSLSATSLLFLGDPDSGTRLYDNNVTNNRIALETSSTGIYVNSEAATTSILQLRRANTIVTEVLSSTGGPAELRNRATSGVTRLTGKNAALTEGVLLVEGDPDGAVELYNNGNLRLSTSTTGFYIEGSSTTNSRMEFRDNGATTMGRMGFVAGSKLQVYNSKTSGHVIFYGNNSAAALTTILEGDPDGPVTLRYAGTTEFVTKSGGCRVDDELEIDGALNHDGSTVGFYGTTPAAQSAAYTRSATVVEDRTLLASASATTLNNNNVLAALIADLQSIGILA
jgi:hypothetical protein